MNEYQVHENQTLQDVAAHVYGRVDVVFDLALLNNISITDALPAGSILNLVDMPVNTLVKNAILSRNIIPAVDYTLEGTESAPKGIGSMIIENNFIVG